MENNIDYKRLYELSIIEKEQILTDNQKKQEKINKQTIQRVPKVLILPLI